MLRALQTLLDLACLNLGEGNPFAGLESPCTRYRWDSDCGYHAE